MNKKTLARVVGNSYLASGEISRRPPTTKVETDLMTRIEGRSDSTAFDPHWKSAKCTMNKSKLTERIAGRKRTWRRLFCKRVRRALRRDRWCSRSILENRPSACVTSVAGFGRRRCDCRCWLIHPLRLRRMTGPAKASCFSYPIECQSVTTKAARACGVLRFRSFERIRIGNEIGASASWRQGGNFRPMESLW